MNHSKSLRFLIQYITNFLKKTESMYDLHCHSHFSDGALSPEALLKQAIQAGVTTLALTDHDTTAGLALLHRAAREQPIQIINGIELSVRWKKHDLHVIGLNINPEDAGLSDLINQQTLSRTTRAIAIGERLKGCGVQAAYEKACAVAGHDRIGRPHFAQILVAEGVAADMNQAFKRFLGRGKLAYVETPWLNMESAVLGLVKAGGQAVIAHPLKYALTRSALHALIRAFKMAGGVGLEVISGQMIASQINALAGLCIRFELLASTGSDFHGDGLSRVGLGRQQPLPAHCTPIWDQWNG